MARDYESDWYEDEEVPQVRGRRATVTYEQADNGCMEETNASVRQRIACMWGFRTASVALMEGDYCTPFEMGGAQFYAYRAVRFAVAGVGWSTDFREITRAPEFDDEGGE